MQKKNNKRHLMMLGVILCLLGLYLVSYNYLDSKVLKAYENMNLQILSLNDELEEKNEITKENEENISNNQNENQVIESNTKQENKPKIDIYEKYYVARLKIPKINLEKGLVSLNSKYNTVSKNIQIIKGSDYPNVSGSNLILASHAGTNSVSYFRNLYKLVKGDKCYITYQGKTYVYKIINIYYQEKDGTIAIYRDYTKTTLTLVTCTKNSDTKQTIYIAELVEIK